MDESKGDVPVAPERVSRLAFRPDIEGLRAVAVALVVLLHAGVTRVGGGYVGVDVFFVISGFLITSLLIEEGAATGRISIPAFYSRRARRILPVACAVIAVTVVATFLRVGPLVGRTTAVDGEWAAGFLANFRFIRQGTDYFASALPPSPLLHYWSLAVEEQFYVVWPSLVFGLLVLGRRLARPTLVLRLGVGAIVAASLFWSVHESVVSPTTAYFSPLTRTWELGVGALVALLATAIATAPAVLRALATWVGLALIATAALTFTATTVFPGYTALLPVAGAAFVIAGGVGGPRRSAGNLLAFPPLRWLGRISFSVYLWHWPVLIIAEDRSATPLSNTARAVCIVVTLVLSIASYFAIERPLRSTHLLKVEGAGTEWFKARKALAAGVAMIVVAAAVSAYTGERSSIAIDNAANAPTAAHSLGDAFAASIRNPAQRLAYLEGKARVRVRQGLRLHEIPRDLTPPVLQIGSAFAPKFRSCVQLRGGDSLSHCTFGAVDSHRTIVIIGDSHAAAWTPALDLYGRRAGYRIVTLSKAQCPVPSVRTFTTHGAYPECSTWRTKAFEYIRTVRPDAVVLAYFQGFTSPGARDLGVWRAGLRVSLRLLARSGARVIEIGPNTFLPLVPGLCLSRAAADPAACTVPYWPRVFAAAERAVIRDSGATYIDTEPWFCFHHRCPLIIDDRIVYADISHITTAYALDVEPLIAASFEMAGLR